MQMELFKVTANGAMTLPFKADGHADGIEGDVGRMIIPIIRGHQLITDADIKCLPGVGHAHRDAHTYRRAEVETFRVCKIPITNLEIAVAKQERRSQTQINVKPDIGGLAYVESEISV